MSHYHIHWFCFECNEQVSEHTRMYSDGCCPHCGHTVGGSIMHTVTRHHAVVAEKPWWKLWTNVGEFVEKV